ncbi:aminotransferase class I/II-fold pyridoxal phosphate-dependent enzyme [Colwellia psychrerythraea]|uniref:Putative 7-keto-8-aminopelargonic acid synthetase n=1 Tax=Colwellia psychrerythraea (strain 34H / ATCC BAA-681) TaxID=167879 RepID=Q481F9_COLP3|nr:8-amino-7-oxononanoate synthase [Colwellia psychrerythraea]AAZ25718.1 putative 7-keto-8-aminopelargonic acid synthetase [Colwellia psychrerythraea 34H]
MNFDFIQHDVIEQKTKSRYRQLVCNSTTSQSNEIIINGKSYLNFSSNDYLGLNNHAEINKALREGADRFGVCSSSSSLVTGYHYAHQALEADICQWLNKPKCLLFSSGFAANLALFQALGKNEESHFYLDKLSHASMIDGAYHSKAKVKRFNHNNIEHLTTLLSKTTKYQNKLIASEGVFSMDGCQAKVLELAQVAKSQQAWLYLDDAHSIGVIGNEGQGSNYFADIDITMATMGKAIGTSGAFLTCSDDLHEYMVNFSRHYIYSTAISPAIAWATKKSIELIQKEQWRREKISELSALFTQLLAPEIELVSTESSIHAIIIGDEKKALTLSDKLKKQGIWLTAIRPPTVAVNSSRLRVTICANHNIKDIMYLAECINKAIA